MPKPVRFIIHILGCLAGIEGNFFRVWRFYAFLASSAIFSVPWIPWFKTEVSAYAGWFWAVGIATCLLIGFWHSFSLFDGLRQKAERRLRIQNPSHVDNRHGKNRHYQIDVVNTSSSDIHSCKAVLKQIDRNGQRVWGGQNAALTFQPAEDDDATRKTIRPETEEHLDVIVLQFLPFSHTHSANVDIAYQNWDTRQGDIKVLPCTKGRQWIFDETVEEIFAERADYFLTLEIGADGTPTTLVKLKFHYDGGNSTLEIVDQRVKALAGRPRG
jgi:hypothetical protein